MADRLTAGSFINSLLRATISNFRTLGNFRFGNRILPFVEGGRRRLDFLVETDDGRYVMLEMQTDAADCLGRQTLLSAASVFQVQLYQGRRTPGWDGGPRAPAKRDVYVIQIIASGSREAPQGAGIDRHFVDGNDAVSVEIIDGIYLIEIELPQIEIRFPVADEVASGWNELDWWYYLLKFSSQFTDDEIRRCRSLGISERVVIGLTQLTRNFWPALQRDEYKREVSAVHTTFKELRQKWLADMKAAELRRYMEELVRAFLDTGSLNRAKVPDNMESFSLEFARKIWVATSHHSKTEGLYVQFIRALDRDGFATH
jgi:hypothetical protein